jgi:hypothetical protein
MSLADQVIAAVILAGALLLLWRSLSKRQGACHGCGGCGSRPRERDGIVKLGGGRGAGRS